MMTETVTREWVDSVLEQHQHLRAVVADLEDFLDAPRPDTGLKGAHSWAVDLSQRLLALHDELFRHFRFEVDVELIDETLTSHPEAANQFREMLSEHPAILAELRAIVSDVLSYSEGVSPENPRLRRRLTKLLATFHRHEEEENHLFQRLEYRDTGAVD
jgi:hypothetical protein